MSDMFCAECGLTILETPLFRDNEKGQDAVWKCGKHVTRKVDSEVKKLTGIIHRGTSWANNG